ncbi:hypothetical protein RJ55_04608 [Drechmeria coniospora]|nr:hypothetical protein RJ55_04608 [Drechmeria coniospora]
MSGSARTEKLDHVAMSTNLHGTYLAFLLQACASLFQQSRQRWSRASSAGTTNATLTMPANDRPAENLPASPSRAASKSKRPETPLREPPPPPPTTTTTPSTSKATSTGQYPDHAPDEDEMERRRLGEAQPQMVPTEVFLDRYCLARAMTATIARRD